MPDRLHWHQRVMSDLADVWQQQNIRITTKIWLYSASVMSVLLYGAETSMLTEQELVKVQAFHTNCQCHILDFKWYDFVTNESICTATSLADTRDIIQRRRLGLFGHVARFDRGVPAAGALVMCCDSKDFTLPDSTGRRPRGHPRHSWLHQVYRDSDMSASDALTLAQDRYLWRVVATASGLGAQ